MISLWPPALVIFTDRLPDDVGGQARGPVVFIKTKYTNDVGLLMHELTHVAQWWSSLALHPFLYRFWKFYRLQSEAAAYFVQMQYPDRKGHFVTLDEAAEMLAKPRYRLDLSVADARVALQQ